MLCPRGQKCLQWKGVLEQPLCWHLMHTPEELFKSSHSAAFLCVLTTSPVHLCQLHPWPACIMPDRLGRPVCPSVCLLLQMSL